MTLAVPAGFDELACEPSFAPDGFRASHSACLHAGLDADVMQGVPLDLSVSPNAAEALLYVGHAGQALDAGMEARLSRAVELCSCLKPRGLFRVFDASFASADASVALEGCALALPGHDISKHLAHASKAALLVATLGLESERIIKREAALSAVDGMLVDAVASAMAEGAICALHDKLRSWADSQGLRAGERFSPGYGDLPLDVQPALLSALSAGKLLGLSVTQANVLIPSKSVTAVVGLWSGDAQANSLEKPDALSGAGVHASQSAESHTSKAEGLERFDFASACETCRLANDCLLRRRGCLCQPSLAGYAE